jgi:hypothetical protein
MNRFKAHPVFFAVLGLLLLGAATGVWWSFNRSAAATGNERRLQQAMSRLQDFSRVQPAPTVPVAELIEADKAAATAAVAAMRAQLAGASELARQINGATPPAQRADAFFDIARFVEAQRAAANAAGIQISPTEAFGFSAFANSGPALEQIPQVHRQRLIADYLLRAAFAARPQRFDGLDRHRTGPAAAGGPRDGGDYFEINPRITARREGFINTVPLRVRFSGQTSSLRLFLNELARYELPLLVRSVEVEPAADLNKQITTPAAATAGATAANPVAALFGTASSTAANAAPAVETPVPIVADNYSRFIVTVEYLELQTPAAAAETDEEDL